MVVTSRYVVLGTCWGREATPQPSMPCRRLLRRDQHLLKHLLHVWHQSQASLFVATKPYGQSRQKAQLVPTLRIAALRQRLEQHGAPLLCCVPVL